MTGGAASLCARVCKHVHRGAGCEKQIPVFGSLIQGFFTEFRDEFFLFAVS